MKTKRNGAVDFWRFIFAAALVVFHTHVLDINGIYKQSAFPLHKGSLAVEFFLLTSGFLLAMSMNKPGRNNVFSWGSTWRFIKGKIMAFYPAFVICWILAFILTSAVFFTDVQDLIIRFFRSVFELTLLRNAGYDVARVLPQAWYLSAMILVMFLLYPLYAMNKKRFEYYIAPMIALFVLGYLFFNTESLLNPSKEMFFTFKGNLRVLAEICLGVVCYNFYRILKDVEFTRFGSVVLAGMELFGYVFAILYMQFYKKFPTHIQFAVLLFLAVSITVSFSEKSVISPLFDNRFCNLLGRYSLYPFLMYSMFAETLPAIFPNLRMKQLIAVYLAFTFGSSAVVMALHRTATRKYRSYKKRKSKEQKALETEGEEAKEIG